MLSDDTRQAIVDCAREFDVRAVWLFGSSLGDAPTARDIDLAVEGLAPKRFYDFYGRLLMVLDKPVDLVDLAEELPICDVVREKGVRIYGR